MPEVIFNGPEGRLEGRYQQGKDPNAPIAIVLHPHPEFGGTMNNQIVYHLFYMFAQRGFSVLLMRRPEVEGFISVSPPENLYDFSFLAPCPSSGLIIHGDKDRVAPPQSVQKLVDKLKAQKGITIEQQLVEGANHFYENKVDELIAACSEYLDRRRAEIAAGKGR